MSLCTFPASLFLFAVCRTMVLPTFETLHNPQVWSVALWLISSVIDIETFFDAFICCCSIFGENDDGMRFCICVWFPTDGHGFGELILFSCSSSHVIALPVSGEGDLHPPRCNIILHRGTCRVITPTRCRCHPCWTQYRRPTKAIDDDTWRDQGPWI
jgi:hypothetical protein